MTPIVEVRDLRVRFTGGRTAYAVMWIAYRGPRCIETGQHRGLPLSRHRSNGPGWLLPEKAAAAADMFFGLLMDPEQTSAK
jgi:hypothetical protein